MLAMLKLAIMVVFFEVEWLGGGGYLLAGDPLCCFLMLFFYRCWLSICFFSQKKIWGTFFFMPLFIVGRANGENIP